MWAFVIALSVNANPASLQPDESLSAEQEFVIGSIVMDDIVAFVNTGNPANSVTSFTVYDGPNVVYYSTSCSGSSCDYDLSGLSAGTYFASAKTASGPKVEDYITIN